MTFATTNLLKSIPQSMMLRDVRTGAALDHEALSARVDVEAAAIRLVGVEAGARVVVAESDPLACLTALFAVWTLGACAVLVNPKLSEDEKARVVAKVGARLWVDGGGRQSFEPKTALDNGLPGAALILMTSGTTGDPKGIVHSLATLERRLELNVAEIGEESLRETLCTLPLFFGHGLIGNCLSALYAGQTVHLMPTLGVAELPGFGATLDRLDITFFSSVPSMWRMVLQMSPPPKSAPVRVHVGSAPLSEPLWRSICDWCGTGEVFNTYGMTETANWVSGGRLTDASVAEGFVGRPWGGAFKVLREGQLCDVGKGEVAVKSPSMMLGLWGAPEATRALMKGDYMLTGDIGQLEADQTLRLLGRNKHEINRGGIKVLAEEVDMLLERHVDVIEACAFGIPDEISGEVVGAVVKAQSPALTAEALLDWCRAHARIEAVPFQLEIVDDIPKNDRGKIARADVRGEMVAKWS